MKKNFKYLFLFYFFMMFFATSYSQVDTLFFEDFAGKNSGARWYNYAQTKNTADMPHGYTITGTSYQPNDTWQWTDSHISNSYRSWRYLNVGGVMQWVNIGDTLKSSSQSNGYLTFDVFGFKSEWTYLNGQKDNIYIPNSKVNNIYTSYIETPWINLKKDIHKGPVENNKSLILAIQQYFAMCCGGADKTGFFVLFKTAKGTEISGYDTLYLYSNDYLVKGRKLDYKGQQTNLPPVLLGKTPATNPDALEFNLGRLMEYRKRIGKAQYDLSNDLDSIKIGIKVNEARGYYAAVDDIVLKTAPNYDVNVASCIFSNNVTSSPYILYHKIPLKSKFFDNLTFGVRLINEGDKDISKIRAKVEIKDGNGVLQKTIIKDFKDVSGTAYVPFPIFTDTLITFSLTDAQEMFTLPNTAQKYDIKFKCLAYDSNGDLIDDGNKYNDSLTTKFELTEHTYSMDNENYFRAAITNDMFKESEQDNQPKFANIYLFNSPGAVIDSLEVVLDESTSVSNSMTFKVALYYLGKTDEVNLSKPFPIPDPLPVSGTGPDELSYRFTQADQDKASANPEKYVVKRFPLFYQIPTDKIGFYAAVFYVANSEFWINGAAGENDHLALRTDFSILTDRLFSWRKSFTSQSPGTQVWTELEGRKPIIRLLTDYTAPTSYKEIIKNNDADNNLKISPNPTSDEVNIKFKLKKSSKVQSAITDITGKLVYFKNDGDFSSGQSVIKINCSNLPAGTYFYVMQTDKATYTKKFAVIK